MSQQPKQLTINSLDRNVGSNSTTDYNVNILPAITNAKKFTLASASIPNTTYNVSSSNNTLYWTDSTTATFTTTISPGSYSATTLASAIQTAMNSVSSGYMASYSSTTYLLTVANSGLTFYFSFGTNTTNSLAYVMGFATNGTLAASQTGQNVVNLAGAQFYYLVIDQIPCQCRGANAVDYGSFVVINEVAPDGSINYFNENQNYNTYEIGGGINLNVLHVQLKTWNNQLINLNGADWSFTMSICY